MFTMGCRLRQYSYRMVPICNRKLLGATIVVVGLGLYRWNYSNLNDFFVVIFDVILKSWTVPLYLSWVVICEDEWMLLPNGECKIYYMPCHEICIFALICDRHLEFSSKICFVSLLLSVRSILYKNLLLEDKIIDSHPLSIHILSICAQLE